MAKVDLIHLGDQGAVIFYNVSAAVGKNCPNQRADVLLVQYLLKACMNVDVYADIPATAGLTIDKVVVDGTWDVEWDVMLRNLQHRTKMRGHNILVDGRVDPVTGDKFLGSISHTQYTILYLHNGYGKLRPNDIARLTQIGDCPAELRQVLKFKVQGSQSP